MQNLVSCFRSAQGTENWLGVDSTLGFVRQCTKKSRRIFIKILEVFSEKKLRTIIRNEPEMDESSG